MWQIEIWKVLIRYPGTTTVCKAGISRKCPGATSCTRKPERSMELSSVLRDVRCWRMTVIWFWKFRVYWKRPGWVPALSKTQLHLVAPQEELTTAGDRMAPSAGVWMCSLPPGCKPEACHSHTRATGISWDSLDLLAVELMTEDCLDYSLLTAGGWISVLHPS